MTRIARSTVAVLVAVAALVGSTAVAEAAPKAKAKAVKVVKAKKPAAKKPVNPCADPTKIPGVLPFKAEGLTFVRTDKFPSSNTSAVPNRWVNYRGVQVWLSTAVCGQTYRQVFVYSDGQPRPWI